MENFSTHVVSTTEMWNWRLNLSTKECQMSYNSSNNQMEQRSFRKTDDCASYTLSSGELSSSSKESEKKKRRKERRNRKRERRQFKEEKRRKREERRRKASTNKYIEDCFNPPFSASKRIKYADVFERVDRSAPIGSKSKDTVSWVASKVTKTTSTGDSWIANSNLNSQSNEITSNTSYLYEAVSSDEDSLLDFTPNTSEANLILSSDALPNSEVAVSVKQLSREELEKIAFRHIALCKKYAQTEIELDVCKGREENFHSMILELNQEVIRLRTKIPPSKTTQSIGVQVQSNSSSRQQSSSSTLHPVQIKIERVENSRDEELITSNNNNSNYLQAPPSTLGGSVVLTPASPHSNN